ncbi:hypothetical protein [Streptomyces sp. NPDC003077]|uniref:hypothetical protein n=1 Tax=Streptomyces sp. NPDC003077 TaxID=3154443 RepID=UPI0033AB74E8
MPPAAIDDSTQLITPYRGESGTRKQQGSGQHRGRPEHLTKPGTPDGPSAPHRPDDGTHGGHPSFPGGQALPPHGDSHPGFAANAHAPLPSPASRPETPDESTQLLRPVKQSPARPAGQPQPRQAPSAPQPGAPAASPSEETQVLPPVPGGGTPTPPPGAPFGGPAGAPADRRTPAEFDGLFRSGAAGASPAPPAPPVADSTQRLPVFDDLGPQPDGPWAGRRDDPPYDAPDDGGRRRRPARAVVIGAAVVALAGAGLGVGWALSGGDEEPTAKPQSPAGTPSASVPAADKPTNEPKPTADPVAEQAKALDALLADSGSSRAAVVNAVKDIRGCDNLKGAAKDLRGAAGQRNDLVTRLGKLPVDKLPGGSRLSASLTAAWKSSASADNHYAAWAGQVAGKKGCHKGKARGTKETAKGNTASGEATKAKREAAALWNPIAKRYGLTERRPEQL